MREAMQRWISWEAPSTPRYDAVARYGLTATAILVTAYFALRPPASPVGGITALVVLIASAWYGGLGPAILAPALLFAAVRMFDKGVSALTFSSGEWIVCGLLTLTTLPIGWSGRLRRRAQAVARRQAAQLHEQARALGLAHIIFRDLDGRITDWTEGAERMYGWTRDEAHGKLLHELLQTRFPKPLAEISAELVAKGEWEGELVNTRRDGAELIVNSHWIHYRSEEGRVPRVAEVNNDVTEVRRAEEAVRESDRRKDRFLATLAHELRNPLAPIRTGLEVLQKTGNTTLNESIIRDVHAMMQRQVGHMVRLIDDLLDVSRINTGKIQLRRERVPLAQVVHDAVEASRPHMDAAGHELTVTVPSEPATLEADRARIAQVLLNLLNNAAKFTGPGGRIGLSAACEGGAAVIRIRDTGIGIPRDMLPRVFDMFTQIDNSPERSQGGLGIGLNLVRTLVEMHGGTVDVHSEGPGQGSEFVVRLPLAVDRAGETLASPAANSTNNAEARLRRFLIVDDSEDAARSLALLLTTVGHDCRTAHDALSALETAAEFRPEVFVLDIGLPGMSGYELAQRIRAAPEFQKAKLIAVTGWGQDEDRRRSREAGFDEHLVKPVTLPALNDLLV